MLLKVVRQASTTYTNTLPSIFQNNSILKSCLVDSLMNDEVAKEGNVTHMQFFDDLLTTRGAATGRCLGGSDTSSSRCPF